MIDLQGKRVDLGQLQTELEAAGIPVEYGLGTADDYLYEYDAEGAPVELPAEAQPVVDAHVPPPLLIDFAARQVVDAVVRTVNDQPLEVFRFPCVPARIYRANLTITGVDAGNFASKIMEGRFTWK